MRAGIMNKDGRVTIPKNGAGGDNLKPGDEVEVTAGGPGRIFVKKVGSRAKDDETSRRSPGDD